MRMERIRRTGFRTWILIGTVAAAVTLGAQSPAPEKLTFEVATIKRNTSGEQSASVRPGAGGRLTITNNSLFNIIRNAYNVQRFQMVPGERVPPWIDTDRWDIAAKASDDATPPQMMTMLQNLLAERFKLSARRETREIPVYALVLARSDGRLGPQLQPSSVDCAAFAAAARAGGGAPPRPSGNGPFCGTRTAPGSVQTSGVLLADFARNLSPQAGRTVIDRTGLSGAFDLELKWTPDQGAATPDLSDRPSLFTAVQEQLGLKLDSQRAPVEVLVIDSAERPTEN